jgi:hypothetical protein
MIKEKAVKRLDGERRKDDSKSRREKQEWSERVRMDKGVTGYENNGEK